MDISFTTIKQITTLLFEKIRFVKKQKHTEDVKSIATGIGNAIVDLYITVDLSTFENIVKRFSLNAGGMNMLQTEAVNDLMNLVNGSIVNTQYCGSIANSIDLINKLGMDAMFIGSVGDDAFGDGYTSSLANKNGVITIKDAITSRSVILIPPTGERTMCTFIDQNNFLDFDAIPTEAFSSFANQECKYFLLEGYLLYDKRNIDCIQKILSVTKHSKKTILITLSDAECVKQNIEIFKNIISQYADIVVGNEAEFSLIKDFIAKDIMNVVTKGANGSIATLDDKTYTANGVPAKQVDSTGAGDAFLAAFIYKYETSNHDIALSLEFANIYGAKAVETIGGRIS